MRQETITKCTPINTKKAVFFKSLVSFYENTIMATDVLPLNDEQKNIAMAINAFDNSGAFLPTFDVADVSVIDASVVKKYIPTMRVKIALYKALVAFFDATIANHKQVEEENHFNNDVNDNFIALAISAMPSFVGVSIIAPKVKTSYEEKKAEVEKQNKKKHYSINVHFDCVVPVEVDAFDDVDALRMAKEIADLSNYDNCYIFDACICDKN